MTKLKELFSPISAIISIVLTVLCFATAWSNHGHASERGLLSLQAFTLCFFVSIMLAVIGAFWSGFGFPSNKHGPHRTLGLLLNTVALVYILLFLFSSVYIFNR